MQEERDAELRYLQENSTAFGDQEAPAELAEQEEPQPQEVCMVACPTQIQTIPAEKPSVRLAVRWDLMCRSPCADDEVDGGPAVPEARRADCRSGQQQRWAPGSPVPGPAS